MRLIFFLLFLLVRFTVFCQTNDSKPLISKFGISLAPIGIVRTIYPQQLDEYSNASDIVSRITIDLNYSLNPRIGIRAGIHDYFEYNSSGNGKNAQTFSSDSTKRRLYGIGAYKMLNIQSKKVYPKISGLITVGQHFNVRSYNRIEPNPDYSPLYPTILVPHRIVDNHLRVELSALFGFECFITKHITLSSELGVDFRIYGKGNLVTKKSKHISNFHGIRALMCTFRF